MLFLNVPFSQKDEVKSLGACWSPKERMWFVPKGLNEKLFERWFIVPKSNVNDVQVLQEKRVLLCIDLVPSSAWFSNLRSELKQEEWELVKKATFKSANYRCQACGGVGPKHPVECHERWNFDSESKIQTLVGTISFCPACHDATHFGLARVRGRERDAIRQLMRVNHWEESKVHSHINEAMEMWKWRSTVKWKLDARWLLNFVPLSNETQIKIINHAEGLCERPIQLWQSEVVSKAMPR